MAKHIKRISIQTVGFSMLLLGVAGVLLPLLNGIVFLIFGLVLLSLYSPLAKRILRYLGSKHPKAELLVVKVEGWVFKFVGE